MIRRMKHYAVAAVAAVGLALSAPSALAQPVAAPTSTEIIETLTDQFYPAFVAVIGVLAVILMVFWVWHKIRGAAPARKST